MLLAGKGGQQDSRRTGMTRKGVDRGAQRDLQLLAKRCSSKTLQFAPHPRITDGAVQRRHGLDDKSLQPLPHDQIGQRMLQRRGVVPADQRKHVALERRRCGLAARTCCAYRQARSAPRAVCRINLARAQTCVHQALDGAQLGRPARAYIGARCCRRARVLESRSDAPTCAGRPSTDRFRAPRR